MPIREYVCIKGHVTEKILFGQRDKTLKQVACDTCQRPAARKDDPPLVARRNPAHGLQK
jgi:hypothetical protein